MTDEERSVLRIGFLRHYAIVITALMVERMDNMNRTQEGPTSQAIVG